MSFTKTHVLAGLAVAGLATAGAVALGTNAFADPTATPTTAPTTSTTAQPGQNKAKGAQDGTQRGPKGQSADTAVTGDEAKKVTDAVVAKNAGVTISEVRKDPDGSYDALGTKADGTKVFYDVSADLGTITENAGGQGGPGGHGGKGGPGGASQDTPVTGDEATKVKDAVVAKNAGVTISEVRKDPDGSYDALGTKADGTKVMYDVSTDLQTITEGGQR